MEGLTTREVKASLRMMGASYRVKIFEADHAFQIEEQMNRWLDGIGTRIDIIEFFPVSVSTTRAIGMASSPKVPSPLRVEITTPGSSPNPAYCSSCSTTITDALSTDQNQQERQDSMTAVGVLYIEYPEKQSE
jgi:hypothetical protein